MYPVLCTFSLARCPGLTDASLEWIDLESPQVPVGGEMQEEGLSVRPRRHYPALLFLHQSEVGSLEGA